MQPFPPYSDLKRFEGDSIAQVSLDPHGVRFAFNSGLLLVAEHRIEQVEPDGSRFLYECIARDGPPLVLHRLLYRNIEQVHRSDRSLTFEIDGGSSLTIFTDVGIYESGNISGPNYPFIVF